MGASYTAIAEKLKCSRSTAHGWVSEYLKKVNAQSAETAEQYRAIQLQRIDMMLMGLMQAAAAGSVFDIDRVIRLHQEQQRLIPGLAVPLKHEVGGMTDPEGNAAGGPIPGQGHRNDRRRSGDVMGMFALADKTQA